MIKTSFVRIAATLAILCLAAPGILSVFFNTTQSKMLYHKMLQEESSLFEVLPYAVYFEPVRLGEGLVYYKALNKNMRVVGYAFETTKRGYCSDIVSLVGMNIRGVISRVKILSQNETPGIGTKIFELVRNEFSGKRVDELKKSVNVIAGATISTRAVIDSVEQKGKEIMEKVSHGR